MSIIGLCQDWQEVSNFFRLWHVVWVMLGMMLQCTPPITQKNPNFTQSFRIRSIPNILNIAIVENLNYKWGNLTFQ